MEIIQLIVVTLLILATAFFVSTEFAIVRVRRTRIEQLIEEGNKNAVAAKKIIDNLDGYLSACQLGITVTALGIGWLGEPAVEHLLRPLMTSLNLPETVSTTLSFLIAFGIITFLHVVVGELTPKTFSIQKTEAVTLLFARPLIIFNAIAYPFIWILNGSARVLSRLFGLEPTAQHEIAHSEEELRRLLTESHKTGEINSVELQYVNKIFEFDNRVVKEIMVPRTEIVCLYTDKSVEENMQIIDKENFTRYPVANGDKDHIIGLVNIKEIFNDVIKQRNLPLKEYIRPVINVLETTPVQDVLIQMQKERIHMAIVVDEYGGTAGLLTVEDILEEIVGEIRDEFDTDEKPMIQQIDENITIIDGKVLISDVNELFGTNINNVDLDTIGGWILSEDLDAKKGTVIHHGDYQFKVKTVDGHQIKEIEVTKLNDMASPLPVTED